VPKQDIYRAALVGCGRIGGFIDNEVMDNPAIVRPYSHAAGYAFVDRTALVACSDTQDESLHLLGETYGVAPDHRYSDAKEMILRERPDIVSVATQPEHRADITTFAAQNGARAIYCEKPLAASLAEADEMIDAIRANDVAFNMGTNRRWHPSFQKMAKVIASGDIGALQAIVVYFNGTLFNTASHAFDLICLLNGDAPVSCVKADLESDELPLDGSRILAEPKARATVQFSNGVSGHLIPTSRGTECEAICTGGTVASLNNGLEWQVRRRSETGLAPGTFPSVEPYSPTARLIEDLVHSLDTGEPTVGGVEKARTNLEILFACVESHVQNGARIPLPLIASEYRLDRDTTPKPIRPPS